MKFVDVLRIFGNLEKLSFFAVKMSSQILGNKQLINIRNLKKEIFNERFYLACDGNQGLIPFFDIM